LDFSSLGLRAVIGPSYALAAQWVVSSLGWDMLLLWVAAVLVGMWLLLWVAADSGSPANLLELGCCYGAWLSMGGGSRGWPRPDVVAVGCGLWGAFFLATVGVAFQWLHGI
jgi:hypothetical protein